MKPNACASRASALREFLPDRRLLVLQNPGRGARNYLEGILAALRRLDVRHCVLELDGVWATGQTQPQLVVQRLSAILIREKIGAVLGYGFNGMSHILPDDTGHDATRNMRSFFEVRGVPHLMLWLDHPHWHADLVGLRPELQPMFRSANNFHFLKDAAHALDMERMLGWPNCFGLPAAVDPDQYPLRTDSIAPDFDLVALCTEGGALPAWLTDFVGLDDPDPAAIRAVIVPQVHDALAALWKAEAPPGMVAELTAMGRKWTALKCAHPFLAAGRHWRQLTDEFPGACWYLTLMYPLWMKAVGILWQLRKWERRFYLAYLARFFKVGVFGADWSALRLGPGGFIPFLEQSKAYARGKVALNITDGHDEEGLTVKPFEIAISGVPLLHYRCEELSKSFVPGVEAEVFERPLEARQKLAALLADAPRRKTLADAARARVLREHTWERRIERMFELARIPLAAFRP